ncbi:hypothetical protein RJ55_04292 [Drechmeria coniospora]|nr:hypothetical protein RJ55_04292 [Drechmeria coniospora]
MEGRLHRLLLACLLFCQWISARPLSDASFVDGSDESPSIGLSFLPGPRHEGDVFTTGAKPIPAGQADGDELDHGPSYVSTTESFEVASRFALMANALGKRRIEDASTEPLVREGNSPAEASGGSSASQNDGNATAIPATASDAARVFLTKPDGRYIYVGNSDKFGRGGELAALHGIPHDRIIGVVYLDDPELKITFNPHYNHAYDSQVAGGDDSELVVELQPDPVSGLQHGPLDKVTPESKNKATKRTLSALNIVQAAELEAARLRQESTDSGEMFNWMEYKKQPRKHTNQSKKSRKQPRKRKKQSRVRKKLPRMRKKQPRVRKKLPRMRKKQPRMRKKQSRKRKKQSRKRTSQPRKRKNQPRKRKNQQRKRKKQSRKRKNQPRKRKNQPRERKKQSRESKMLLKLELTNTNHLDM